MILSTSTPDEIRHAIGMKDDLTVADLAEAVMVLCKRVEELQREVKRLTVNPDA